MIFNRMKTNVATDESKILQRFDCNNSAGHIRAYPNVVTMYEM